MTRKPPAPPEPETAPEDVLRETAALLREVSARMAANHALLAAIAIKLGIAA